MDHYAENMFDVGEQHKLKPMNCPGHVQIFNSNMVSYRDLPMRLAEFGCCHRDEPGGALHGIMRLRQFVQDDAHIFCSEIMVEKEVISFCSLLQQVYEDFGFSAEVVGISLRPEEKSGSDELWDRAEAALISAVEAAGLPYVLQPGEGAFYGPKLEFSLKDKQGRVWQCGTLQLDFVLPGRLGASYVDSDNQIKVPVMIHRAILGSMERFIGIVLEHYEGKLPHWLAPVQAVIVPVSADQHAYAESVRQALWEKGWRVEVDLRELSLMSKVKKHSEQFVPSIMVVGAREQVNQQVSIRRLGSNENEVVSVESL